MARALSGFNRLDLNYDHGDTESSSRVEASRHSEDTDSNLVTTEIPCPADNISIQNFIEELKTAGDKYHVLGEHFIKSAEAISNAFQELNELKIAHEKYLLSKTDSDDHDEDFDGTIRSRQERIQELVDFIQESISSLRNFHSTKNNSSITHTNNADLINFLTPLYPSHEIPRAEFDDSSEVAYSSGDDESEVEEDKQIDSSLTKYINDHVISVETKQHQIKFEMHNIVHQENAKANTIEKIFYNSLAGTVGYLTAFGVANLAAKLTPGLGPFMIPILAAPLHTFVAGPLSGMIRSTTWVNPATKEQITHQRARARAQGDQHRKAAGLESKIKFVWQGERLTAEEILKKDPNFKNWYCKVVTDDVPFFSFLGFYLIRNFLIEILRPPLDQPDLSAIPSVPGYRPEKFFSTHTAAGFAADLGLQTLAGTLSGALTMLISQAIRANIKDYHCFEAVTKTKAIWNLERIYLTSCRSDFESAIEKVTDPELKALLEKECHKINLQCDKAEKKSSFLSSYWYEVNLLWQEKTKGIAGDPDQPGTRLDTICDIAGKFISLVPVAITSQLVSTYAPIRAASTTRAWFQMYGRVLAPPLALMGFLTRTEISGYIRLVYGDIKGRNSAKAHTTATDIEGILASGETPPHTPIKADAESDSDSIV
jgi:hypothetical protein